MEMALDWSSLPTKILPCLALNWDVQTHFAFPKTSHVITLITAGIIVMNHPMPTVSVSKSWSFQSRDWANEVWLITCHDFLNSCPGPWVYNCLRLRVQYCHRLHSLHLRLVSHLYRQLDCLLQPTKSWSTTTCTSNCSSWSVNDDSCSSGIF